MAKQLWTNDAYSTLAGGITDVATSMSVQAGHGARFPALSGGDWFIATIINSSKAKEIVKVTSRSTDTFGIVRAQESTSAAAWLAGDRVALRLTAGGLNGFRASPVFTGNGTIAGSFLMAGGGYTDEGSLTPSVGVATTMFAAGTRGTYLVSAQFREGGSTYDVFAIVNTTGTPGATLRAQWGGANLSISVSGSNVQITNSGSSSLINWGYLLIPSGA